MIGNKRKDKPLLLARRRLTGIKKKPLENSSSSHDFPIPDNWTIEQ